MRRSLTINLRRPANGRIVLVESKPGHAQVTHNLWQSYDGITTATKDDDLFNSKRAYNQALNGVQTLLAELYIKGDILALSQLREPLEAALHNLALDYDLEDCLNVIPAGDGVSKTAEVPA